jgi:hypothetical protein
MQATMLTATTQSKPPTTTDLPLFHPEFADLWAGIEAAPVDAAPILVAADWLTENDYRALATAFAAVGPDGVKVGPNTIRLRARQMRAGVKWCSDATNAKGRPAKGMAYYFPTVRRALDYVAGLVAARMVTEERKAAERQQVAEAKANWVNPFKVGQLLYNSWGYDETHYDFAEIVAVGARSVTVRRIGSRLVEDRGFVGRYIAPVAGAYLEPRGDAPAGSYRDRNSGDARTVIVKFRTNSRGELATYLPGWSLVEERERFYDTSGTR